MIARSREELEHLLHSIVGPIAFDTETIERTPPNRKPRDKGALILDRAWMSVISFAGRNADGELFSFCAMAADVFGELPIAMSRKDIVEAVRPFLEEPEILKIAHNANYDAYVMYNQGVVTQNVTCTLVEGRCWNENIAGSLKERGILVGDLLRKTATISLDKADELLEKYAEQDAKTAYKLWEFYREGEGAKTYDAPNRKLHDELERPLLAVVQSMERVGFPIDIKHIEVLRDRVHHRVQEAQKKIYAGAGQVFNMNSPAQLSKVLYHDLGLPQPEKKKETSKHAPTDEKALFENSSYQIVKDILEYRKMSKVHDTYLSEDNGFVSYADEHDRIHTTLQQVGAATSRFSCSMPRQSWAFQERS